MRRTCNSTKQEILLVQPPQSTRTYKTISHGAIIDTLSEQLDKEGFRIKNERYLSTLNRQIVNGHLSLDLDIDSELQFEIAFLNSYNKTKKAIVVGGSEVVICHNGHILGDSSYGVFRKKHVGTADIKIVEFIQEMIKSARERFDVLIKQKQRMKEIEIDKKVRNELIGQLYLDETIIKETQMSIIRKEVLKSSFDYNSSPDSLWQLYNNITVGMKSTHPASWIHNHQALNNIVNEKFQLV